MKTKTGGDLRTSKVTSAIIEGLPVSLSRVDEVLAEMRRAIDSREVGHYISITNTESMYHGLRSPEHGSYIRDADFSLCDGVGVIVAGWFWGHRICRLNGPVLQLEATANGVAHGWRHFFYGGKEGVADEMARRLEALYPGAIFCGAYCPPFRPMTDDEDEALVAKINEARPDIVWVGLGLLKQERWIAQHLHRVKAPWMVGVGAAFDYHAGAIPWAPPMLRAVGMEWLFRLVLQPRLRARRYWWSFVYVIEAAFSGLVRLKWLGRPETKCAEASSLRTK